MEEKTGPSQESNAGGAIAGTSEKAKEVYDNGMTDLDSKEMAKKTDLRILLVGHTGHGKSTTGNTLFGKEVFKSKRSSNSVTETTHRKVKKRFGRKIEIVDTPGFCDTRHEEKFILREITKCIGLLIPGPHAILFVLKPERFTDEIVKTVDTFFEVFGQNVDKLAFIVLTHTADENQKLEYIGRESKDRQAKLDELMRRCKGKVLLIDNSKDCNMKQKYTWDIFQAIDDANAHRGEPCFTNPLIKAADKFALEELETSEPLLSSQTKIEHRELFKQKLEEDKSFLDKFTEFLSKKQLVVTIGGLAISLIAVCRALRLI